MCEGLLVGHLQNEFRQVALRHLDASGLQRVVEARLFRGDAFPFHHQLDFVLNKDVADVLIGVCRAVGEQQMTSVGSDAGFPLTEQLGQVGDGLLFCLPSPILHLVVIGNA